jgi:hypothetical protein
MPTVDELITVYRLVDNYSDNAIKISNITLGLTGNIGKLIAMTIGLEAALTTVAIKGLYELGKEAVTTQAKFEQLDITLTAITKDPARAASIAKLAQELAIPAKGTALEFEKAATQIEAYGLRAERVLPTVAKLATAFGGGNEKLAEATRLFGQMASGVTPTARQLAIFGISKRELADFGILIDAHGQLIGTALQKLTALEAIVQQNWGNILELMANSTDAALTNVENSWQQAMKRLGEILKGYLLPAMEKLVYWLDHIDATKFIHFGRVVFKVIETLVKSIEILISLLIGLGAGAIYAGFIALITWIATATAGMSALAVAAAIVDSLIGNWPAILTAIGVGIIAFTVMMGMYGKFQKLNDTMMKGLEDLVTPGAKLNPYIPHPEGEFGEASQGGDEALSKLGVIAKNTGRTANNTEKALDMKKFALGGGPLGQFGITPAEMFGSSRSGQPIRVRFDGGNDLTDGIEKVVNDVINDLIRRGSLSVGL